MPLGETKGLRILIVEDEILVAMNVEDMVVELRHTVAAVATRLNQALTLAASSEIDLAILDLNLSGSLSFPVADILRQRGIPFMFATGYGAHGLTEEYRNETVLVKPYGVHQLENAIKSVIAIPVAQTK